MTTKQEIYLAPRVQQWTNLSSGLTAGGFFLFMRLDDPNRKKPFKATRDWKERYWEKVDKNGPIPVHCPELGPCWEWQRKRCRRGYGQFRLYGKLEKAHRVAFLSEYGRWPTPCACHHCDNPPCCNPSHLFEGTLTDNSRDCKAKGRMRRTPLRGERATNVKLTWAIVDEIRIQAKLGTSSPKLAKGYGVRSSTIRKIIHNQRWKPEHRPTL